MDKQFTSWGFYKFFPDKKKKKLRYKEDSFWAVLEVDNQIVDYYYSLLKKEYPEVEKPTRKAHITICKGEKIKNFRHEMGYLSKKLGKMQTKCVTYTFSNKIETNGTHFFIKVKSNTFSNFRKYLGLSDRLKHDFHLTIGKIKKNEKEDN